LSKSHLFKLPRLANCVGFWPTREGTGTTTKDIVGGNTGTLVNTPTWAQDANGQWGTTFTAASSQYISLGNPAALRLSTFTWAVYVTPTGTITDNAYRPFVGAYNAAGSRVNYAVSMWRSGLANGRKPYMEFSSSGGSLIAITGTTLLASGTTYLIVGSFDGTTARIYVNGAEENSGTPGFSPDTSTSMNIMLGKLGDIAQYSSHTHHWAAMWNKALDASEIAYISKLGSF
jgi:hypothetical protein